MDLQSVLDEIDIVLSTTHQGQFDFLKDTTLNKAKMVVARIEHLEVELERLKEKDV